MRPQEVVRGQISKSTKLRHVIHFWKAESERKQDLLKFLRSEVVRGRKRLTEVNFQNQHNLDMLYIFGKLRSHFIGN